MAFTGATAGYQAGIQANDTRLSYAREVTYGVAPNGPYQRLRLTGENFRRQNTRQRPEEIDPRWESSQAVTTQQSVGGTLSGALSFGTYDDLFACVCSGNVASHTADFPEGQTVAFAYFPWSKDRVAIATSGNKAWTNLEKAGFAHVKTKSGKVDKLLPYMRPLQDFINIPNDSFETLPGDVTEGTTATETVITNQAIFNSLTVIEQLGENVLVRTGGFVRQIEISIAQGQFATFSADMDFRDEQRHDTSPATSLLRPTDSFVLDPVTGWGAIWFDLERLDATVRQLSLTLMREGAGQDFALGSEQAAGQRAGSFTASGQIQLFFRDWTEYQKFEQGWQGPIHIRLNDNKKNVYGFTFFSATLQNPQINAGSKNTTIVATFDIEGNPQSGGGTFSLSIFPA